MLWRLHIRPTPKNGKTHNDVVTYCIENHVAGIGWPVPNPPQSPSEYEQAALAFYGVRCASIPFALYPKPGDFIWARDKNGKYYLGRLKGKWFYSTDPLHLELDIPNQRQCEWIKIRNQEHVPGKIVACFRPAKAFQAIHDEVMEKFSEWAFVHHHDEHPPKREFIYNTTNKTAFFKLIGADDCEDIVGLYLQKIKGYCLIPSTCKQTTIGYEFVLKHSQTFQTAVVQVKQGNVGLNDGLLGTADHIYLFSTEGVVIANSDKITILSTDEMFDFVCQNTSLLPGNISYWLHFLN